MHALMNIVVQGHVAYRSIDDVLSITSRSSNTTLNMRSLQKKNYNDLHAFCLIYLENPTLSPLVKLE